MCQSSFRYIPQGVSGPRSLTLLLASLPSYNPDLDSDPFGEDGSLWSFNYFFYNKRLKRIVFFSCRSIRFVLPSSLPLAPWAHTISAVLNYPVLCLNILPWISSCPWIAGPKTGFSISLPSGSTYTPSEAGNELDMELGEEEAEEESGGRGSEGGAEETSTVEEDRYVMVVLNPWNGWISENYLCLVCWVVALQVLLCQPLPRVPVICM